MFSVMLVGMYEGGTYGHRCLSAGLRHAGFSVSDVLVRSGTVPQDAQAVSAAELQAVRDLTSSLGPSLVGINVHSTFGHPLARAIVACIKDVTGVPVVLGGVHPSLMTEYCLRDTRADLVCVGEGDESFVDLCRRAGYGEALVGVPGFRSRESQAWAKRAPPEDLDSLPFAYVGNEGVYRVEADGTVREGDPLLEGTTYATKCSRGCPFRCSFCSVEQLRSLSEGVPFCRLRSPEHVVREVRSFLELNPGCNHVRFWDDTFPFRESWVEDFAQRYGRAVGLPFTIYLNPDTTRERNIALLAAAGLRRVVMGIESASDSTRNGVFMRTETRDDVVRADRILWEHGISRTYDLLLDHPWESDTELEDAFHLVMSLREPLELNMHSLVLLPGTTLAKRAISEGLTDEDHVMSLIVSNVRASARGIQWVRGIPAQEDLRRAYWLFLLRCAGHRAVPPSIARLLARSGLLRRHPALVADKLASGEWRVLEPAASYRFLAAVHGRAPVLRRVLARLPSVKAAARRVLAWGDSAGFLTRIVFRILTRLPRLGPPMAIEADQPQGPAEPRGPGPREPRR